MIVLGHVLTRLPQVMYETYEHQEKPMDPTTAKQIGDLLEELNPLLKEEVDRLEQASSQKEPLIQRLLKTEIQKRRVLILRLEEAVQSLSIGQNESWTVERFQEELLSSERYRNHYESKNQTEKLCDFGVDLMNLREREQWQLTPKFNKNYFALKFRGTGRRVFGIRVGGNEFALRVWLPADVLAEHNNDQYTYTYRDWGECGEYPVHVMVADIKNLIRVCI